MLPALLAAFLAAECLAAPGDRLPSLVQIIPQDLQSAFAVPATAGSIPTVPGVPLGAIMRLADPAPMRGSQVVKVDLQSLFNRHLKNAESFSPGQDAYTLSTQVDLKGDAYLSLQGRDWAYPYFFEFKAGMHARWRSADGKVYDASIDGSIFRRKFNNPLVIHEESTGREVYSRKLTDFFNAAAVQGETVAIGGNTYKAFYSYALDTSRYPAVFDQTAYGLCLLYDESDDPGYHDFKNYPIPFDAVKGDQPAAYRLHNGQVLYFKLAEDQKTLVISD
ncbi:MAG: hypothetical protein NTY77_03375 [Elusimicrobia bacterium]|nr:hypothetical protein [Elusimicrobiota bacterium]